MAESAALVPAPFFAPVRTGTGSLLKFGARSGRPPLLEHTRRKLAPGPDEGMAYSRDARLVADLPIGTLVNIYV